MAVPAPFRLTPRALDDLSNIWDFIAADNPQAAARVQASILSACATLARFPGLGSKRPDLTALAVRFWSVTRFPNFVSVYRPTTVPLEIVAVLHARQDLAAILREQGPV